MKINRKTKHNHFTYLLSGITLIMSIVTIRLYYAKKKDFTTESEKIELG